MAMSLHDTIRHISKYFERYSDMTKAPYRLVDGERLHVSFDPNSYDQVLVVSELQDDDDVVLFAATEFGLYIRLPDADAAEHFLYHDLLKTHDFHLTIQDLADCHYMVKNFPKTWDKS